MTPWRLTEYITEEGRFPFNDWYLSQDAAVRAAFDAARKILSTELDWEAIPVVLVKELTKRPEHRGLIEMRYSATTFDRRTRKSRNRRVRPLGVWSAERSEFVLLGGAEEFGKGYLPADAFESAMRFRRMFLEGKGVTREI